MNSKSLLIAIAALALTATGAQAFSSNALITAGLTEEQQAAFEVARELREEGDVTAARDVLVEAGIDAETLEKVRSAMHEERHAERDAINAALDANDFAAFILAIKDSPLSDVITTEEDFASFKEAHELMESGDKAGAKAIFTELGVPEPKHGKGFGRHGMHGEPPFLEQLTDAQKAAFAVARQANDRDAMDAILDEAGVVKPTKGETPKFLKDGRELD
jgi:5-enolpyruvylshikimate-3-phosphate synthase